MRVHSRFALAAAALALLSRAATAQVTCDGEGLAIETDLWGVAGATLQSRVPLAKGGPNLVINGPYVRKRTNDTTVIILITRHLHHTPMCRRLRSDRGRT